MTKRFTKSYTYICEYCNYNTIDEEDIKSHVLRCHGVTGYFGKGYETKTKKFIKRENMETTAIGQPAIITEAKKEKFYRKYLKSGEKVPEGIEVITSKSGKRYYKKKVER